MRDEHVVATPRVAMLSFSATGTPASGPGSRPAATASSTAWARWRARSAVTVLKAWISGSRASIAARCCSTTSAARASPARTASTISATVRRVAMSAFTADHRRHAEAAVLGLRRCRQDLVAVEGRLLDVVTHDVDEPVRLRHRRHVGEVEGVDVGEVLEHVAELGGGRLELVRRELEPSQPGNLGDDVAGDPFRHDAEG